MKDQFEYWLKTYTDRTRFDRGDMAACWHAAQRCSVALIAQLGEKSVEEIMEESAEACKAGIRDFDDAHAATKERLK